jgi:hypothetical protein
VSDTITLLKSTAEALSEIGIGDFSVVELPERMASVVLILQELPDREDRFPHGKWATIQSIQGQLREWAIAEAKVIDEPSGYGCGDGYGPLAHGEQSK